MRARLARRPRPHRERMERACPHSRCATAPGVAPGHRAAPSPHVARAHPLRRQPVGRRPPGDRSGAPGRRKRDDLRLPAGDVGGVPSRLLHAPRPEGRGHRRRRRRSSHQPAGARQPRAPDPRALAGRGHRRRRRARARGALARIVADPPARRRGGGVRPARGAGPGRAQALLGARPPPDPRRPRPLPRLRRRAARPLRIAAHSGGARLRDAPQRERPCQRRDRQRAVRERSGVDRPSRRNPARRPAGGRLQDGLRPRLREARPRRPDAGRPPSPTRAL